MYLEEIDTSKLNIKERINFTCVQCGRKFAVLQTFMWVAVKDRPVCYTCADLINKET